MMFGMRISISSRHRDGKNPKKSGGERGIPGSLMFILDIIIARNCLNCCKSRERQTDRLTEYIQSQMREKMNITLTLCMDSIRLLLLTTFLAEHHITCNPMGRVFLLFFQEKMFRNSLYFKSPQMPLRAPLDLIHSGTTITNRQVLGESSRNSHIFSLYCQLLSIDHYTSGHYPTTSLEEAWRITTQRRPLLVLKST